MNPMRTTKLIVGELMVESRRMWRSASFVAGCAVLGLGLAGGFPVAAQEPDAPAQATLTNNPVAAEVLARISEMVQSTDSAQPEDMAAPDDVAATNGLTQANGLAQTGGPPGSSNRFANPNRSQNDDGRSRDRRSNRSRSGKPGSSGLASDYSQGGDRSQTNSVSGTNRLDYSAFKVVVDRNIFDPNRTPRRPGDRGPRPAPKSVDSLTLVGTMTYEKGSFAFFDGTSSDYKKALKLNDVVAGRKVTNITPNSVKLAAGTNEMELTVGMQLRREEDGPWSLVGGPGSYIATPTSTSTSTSAVASAGSDTAASAAESDIIKKLMQRREKE
jgi:hypothetical protein